MSFNEKEIGEFLIEEAIKGRLNFEVLQTYIDCPPYVNYSETYGVLWHQVWHYLADKDICDQDAHYEVVLRKNMFETLSEIDQR